MIVVPQLAFRSSLVETGAELSPAPEALQLAELGATEISLLDLDGYLAAGEATVPIWLERIVTRSPVPVRLDVRLHDGRRIDLVSRLPLSTVVIDRRAMFDAMLLRWSLDLFGRRACFEVQADGPYVFDPPEGSSMFSTELIDVTGSLHLQGMRRMLYRDVTGDSIPLQALVELTDRLPSTTITYQGQVRTVADVAALARLGRPMEAVLVDAAAVLSGSLDLEAANRATVPGR